MADFYGPGARGLQEQFDARRLADRVQRLVRPALTEEDRAFIEARDMFFLATVDAEGHPNCSYKGGDPGFVRVIDERTLAFPSWNGNGMFLSLGGIVETSHVGLLFIDLDGRSRLRVNGTATIDQDDPLKASCPEAELFVRVHVREVFPNCPRYIHRYTLAERSRFVPREGCTTPVPAWKKSEWAEGSLPEGDPALDPTREVLRR
jgi:uncharacterized protein